MGHLLNNTLQDLLIRYARHCNKSVLWIPGTDHAGISMQVRVEKELAKKGLDKNLLGREKFLEHACSWRDEHGGIIFEQLRKLGVSCDWGSVKHTMDDDYSRGVLTAFVELYNRGYVYRGKRLVNWCPVSLTALSDEEVRMVEQIGKLYYVKYEIAERPGEYMVAATTRPETLHGDVALAVNPADGRHERLVGLHCKHPLSGAMIPIIADEAISKDFGTGVLKITPAHDQLDFEIGQKYGLAIVDVLNADGTLNECGGEWCGMDRFEARVAIASKLKEIGMLLKEEDYTNNVGFSERGNVPIEPRLSEQWFLRYPKVEEAKAAVRDSLIRFHPERWTKVYLHWLDSIKDWCISRQLWWGHRVPVWYKKNSDRSDSRNYHVSVDGPSDIENWERDGDVLDTWFSSWIWPFGVFGWPDYDKMAESGFDYFYPTADLVTGPDIIFFWVARMIMAALEFVGEEKSTLTPGEVEERIPFRDVYFTGIIRDAIGRKMSKSLGNSPDPLDLIERYGADGLRFGLLMSAPYGQDVLFSEERIAQGRNFCNKLWNASRFRLRHPIELGKRDLHSLVSRLDSPVSDDHAILLQLVACKRDIDEHMGKYEITSAVQCAHNFFWNCYCDWYVEVSKHRVQSGERGALVVHDILMRQLLLILNPFVPFITEELWHVCQYAADKSFIQDVHCETADEMLALFEPLELDSANLVIAEKKREFVNTCRLLLAQNKHIPRKSASVIIHLRNVDDREIFSESIVGILGVSSMEFSDVELPFPAAVCGIGTVYIKVNQNSQVIDLPENREKILLQLAEIDRLIASNRSKLSDENFIEKAPEHIIAGARSMLEGNMAKRLALEKILKSL
jgi:valyl-tRNA synthetase